MNLMGFNCQRCGKCCKDLVFKDSGVLRGLTLLPNEIKLFPEDLIKPYLGIGKRPYDKDFRILAYQLTISTCPNLDDNQCNIYQNRPASCRQFPFSLDPDDEGEILLGVDMNCPTAVELINSNQGKIEFNDRESATRLFEIKKLAIDQPRKFWIFDLDSEKWHRFDKLR